ncbi:hypothetical protein KFU94_15035 [Chloroflexi bacterium TSY]|nr:hypothetical protein [Chloroflexi bacterium TSY]
MSIDYPQVEADLIEADPAYGGLGHWILASPVLLFLAWNWIAVFDFFSPLEMGWLNLVLGGLSFLVLIVVPFGYGAHRFVTALPRLFQTAGWEIAPREAVEPAKMYTTRYVFRERRRASTNWTRIILRCAQGWVFLEIAAILAAAVLMIPLFFSVTQFGFGR